MSFRLQKQLSNISNQEKLHKTVDSNYTKYKSTNQKVQQIKKELLNKFEEIHTFKPKLNTNFNEVKTKLMNNNQTKEVRQKMKRDYADNKSKKLSFSPAICKNSKTIMNNIAEQRPIYQRVFLIY